MCERTQCYLGGFPSRMSWISFFVTTWFGDMDHECDRLRRGN